MANMRWIWLGGLGWLIIAGLTGAFFRVMLAFGVTFELSLVNVRHAHSHLMYFGWTTPTLMLLISSHLEGQAGRLTARATPQLIAGFLLVLSVPTFVFFLLRGYGSFAIGGRDLPLSMISAGVHVLGWYAFAVYYFRSRRSVVATNATLAWDLSVALLVLSTFGAWGLSLHASLGMTEPHQLMGLTHFFLDVFSEGWLVLATLGVVHAARGGADAKARVSLVVLALAIPLLYPLALPEGAVSPLLKVLSKTASVLVGLILVLHVWMLRPYLTSRSTLWMVPLGLLALKGLAQMVIGAVPDAWWPEMRGLRILYLHTMLLGFVTLGLVSGARAAGFVRHLAGVQLMQLAVILLLLSLVPLTGIWPRSMAGAWTVLLAAGAAHIPVVAAAWLLLERRNKTERGSV